MPKLHKLDITLIERTKLLEGIMCQSLTFTNAIKRGLFDIFKIV